MQIKKVKKIVMNKKFWLYTSIFYLLLAVILIFLFGNGMSSKLDANVQLVKNIILPKYSPLNKTDYDQRINLLSHLPATSTYLADIESTTSTSTKKLIWPIKTVYPDDGAILPFHRIVAYYGNFLSKGMGVLGQYPESEVLSMLQAEVDKWNVADPNTPVLPAIQYIAVTAQGYPGADKKYRARMTDDQIQKAIDMATKINGIVILDVQIGQSTLENEIPLLEKYLEMPQVHLAIDPEFAMQPGQVPGDIYVGTMDAKDINWTINYLSGLVKQYNLPPKILVIHRYRKGMLTNYKQIEIIPEVQIVMNMDGWGSPSGKTSIYKQYIEDEPVEFTGIKLFYKNDTTNGSTIMTTDKILKLTPQPIYIQYQ